MKTTILNECREGVTHQVRGLHTKVNRQQGRNNKRRYPRCAARFGDREVEANHQQCHMHCKNLHLFCETATTTTNKPFCSSLFSPSQMEVCVGLEGCTQVKWALLKAMWLNRANNNYGSPNSSSLPSFFGKWGPLAPTMLSGQPNASIFAERKHVLLHTLHWSMHLGNITSFANWLRENMLCFPNNKHAMLQHIINCSSN